MNPLNPRSVADHKRYEDSISTEFAKDKFWKIQRSLGHYFWSMAQQALEENLKGDGNKCGRFAAIAAARKAKMQKEWRTQLERKRELQNFARSMAVSGFNDANVKVGSAAHRRQTYLALKKAFNPIVKVDDFLNNSHRKQKEGFGQCQLFVFPKPIPKSRSLTLSA